MNTQIASMRSGSAGVSEGEGFRATRRDILRYGVGAAGALALAGTSMPAGAAPGPFKIALSNAYNGNEWRRQHAEAFERACKEMQAAGYISKYSAVHGSDNSVPAQLAAIGDMILKGNDGILVNCSSGSQVGGVIEQAADAGIKVVSYDAYANSDRSWNIGFDSPHGARTMPTSWRSTWAVRARPRATS